MARQCDEIDYRLIGESTQAVVVTLDPGEQVVAEAGTMLYMGNGIEMQTSMGSDKNKGFFGNLLKAVGRMVTGESFFITTFANAGGMRADVAFSAPYPGTILPLNLAEISGPLLCQKDSFLCAARGTEVGVAFQQKLGAGLFGGEGFVLQKLQGDGLVFIHAGGSVFRQDLAPGETLRVDTGCVVAFESQVQFDIKFVGGFKNALFGGEGLFLTTLTGPGRVYLQTLPFSRLADRVITASRYAGGSKDQSSMLGGLLGGDD